MNLNGPSASPLVHSHESKILNFSDAMPTGSMLLPLLKSQQLLSVMHITTWWTLIDQKAMAMAAKNIKAISVHLI